MKITNTHKQSASKKFLFIVGAALLLIAGTIGVMAATKTGPFTVNSTDSSKTNDPDSTDQPEDPPATNKPDENTNPKAPVNNQPADEGTPEDTLVASISAANQNESALQIRTLIEGVSTNGTCSLKLTMGSRTITRSAGIQALSSTSTCKGFDIPINELSAGNWKLTIDITIEGKKTTLTKTVTIS